MASPSLTREGQGVTEDPLQVLHYCFSSRFDEFYTEVCREVGRKAEFQYISVIADESYGEHEGLLVRDPPDAPLVIGLHQGLTAPVAELTAAHELMHERLIRLGFPLVYADLGFVAPLASAYSSVLSDPLIDGLLLAHSYNPCPLLERDLDRVIADLPPTKVGDLPFRNPEEEVEVLRCLRWVLSPARSGIDVWEEKVSFLRAEYARFWKTVEYFQSIITSIGSETPLQQRDALQALLQFSSAQLLLHVFSPTDTLSAMR